MFNNTMFNEVLKSLPRIEIKKIVEKHGSDYRCKGFETWDHLIAMLAAQFGRMESLREIETAMGSHTNCYYHLNTKQVKRSTLSDANKWRGYQVFEEIALWLLRTSGKVGKEISAMVTVLDSTLICLNGRGHEWAEQTETRHKNRGLKIHVQYCHTQDQIEYVSVDEACINDITVAQGLALKSDRVYVFDKGYYDYNWWKQITLHQSNFVTRLKKNAAYKVTRDHKIAEADKGIILKDQTIVLTNRCPRAKKINELAGIELRLIQIKNPNGKEEPFMIVSNMLEAQAQTIAGFYKERWSIELLFKWLKQNLKIKKFVGESHNAIMIQIFVALIAYLLLKMYGKLTHSIHHRLKDTLTLVRLNLFNRPKLHQRRHEARLAKNLAFSSQIAWEF